MDCEAALEEITRRRSELQALMQEEKTIINGMAFFKIEEPHFKPVQLLEKVRHASEAHRCSGFMTKA